jgi:hypothetical protein
MDLDAISTSIPIADHLEFTDGNVSAAAVKDTAHYSYIDMQNREELESDELRSLIRRSIFVDQNEDLAKMNTQCQSAKLAPLQTTVALTFNSRRHCKERRRWRYLGRKQIRGVSCISSRGI